MSDTGHPPPLPPLAEVVPVHPIPVQTLPYDPLPSRQELLTGDQSHFRRAPGIIIAIGIISIVVGGLGLIGGGLSALYGGLFYFISHQIVTTNTAVAHAAAANPAIAAANHQPPTNEQPANPNADPAAPLPPNSTVAANPDAATALAFVQRQTGNRLTPQQNQTLAAEFANPAGLIRSSATGIPARSQIVSATVQPNGSVMVLTPYGQITVTSAGIVQFRMVYGTAGQPPITNFRAGRKLARVSGPAAGLIVIEGTLSALLSIYLLVIGILTLRQSPSGRRLHVIYVLLKIPLAIICGLAWWWLISGFLASMPGNGAAANLSTVRAVLFALLTGVAVIYPVSLLVAFATPSIRRYYDSAHR